ncbi:T9SS type A sorting domain-containing protein [Epilithonimonas sp. JDS]|nr:T9SS type A sorting domain-containing protein [Epilithonimonas sp. JDS]
MKKLLPLLLGFLSFGMQAQINFPDANFKALLLSSSSSNMIAKNLSGNYFAIDENGDGEISTLEALNVGELMIKAKMIDLGGGFQEPEIPDSEPILDYEGINYFKNATTIDIERSSPPTALLNISGLTNLRSLISVFPYEATLAINNCPALINLKYGGTQLTNISVISQLKSLIVYDLLNYSGNLDILSAIEDAPILENLEFSKGMNVSFIEDSRFSLDLSNHQNIKSVTIKSIGLHSLDLSFCNQLSSLSLGAEYAPYYTRLFGKLDVSNCPSLMTLDLGSPFYNDNNFSNVDPNLVGIKANNCVNLKSIKCGSEFTGKLEVNNCTALTSVELAINMGIQMSNVASLKTISIDKYDEVSFDATPATNLEVLKLSYNVHTSHPYENYYGPLKNLTVKKNVSLKELSINSHKISDVDVSGLQNLEKLHVFVGYNPTAQPFPDFSTDFLHQLNAENCSVLNDLNIDFQAGLIDANFKNCTSLKQYKVQPSYYSNSGIIEKLNFENCTALESIDASRNELKDLNIKNCTSLKSLNLENNQLTVLDVENFIDLEELYCGFNQLTTLNIESNPKLKRFVVSGNPQLNSLFIKNGVESFGEFGPIASEDVFGQTPKLKYICADEDEIPYLKAYANYLGLNDVNINSYCSFTPGGNYNTITGTAKYDSNGNGCDSSDNAFEYLKLKIDDGITSGETFVQNNGEYEFFTQEGNFTVTAQAENPTLFNVSPASFSTGFADANNNTFTQNICVTANGNQNDAEVVIAPLTGARPGFDATYKLVWRNKGNTALSGKVILNFDSNKMIFKESSLPYAAFSNGSLEFDYTHLKPYENDAAEITFVINTPTNPTNPVNSGDVLAFYAQITPSNVDLTPEDNHFAFNHTVVNSFDPNDIVCMEGETIPSVAVGKYLHYVVNFENVGTAEAENIVVKMDIDPAEFDINTLQLQNASADVTTVVTGNQVEFFFKKIKLKSGGHGNVLLKMKSVTNLQEGDQVNNKANIYFDYNFPVETNDYVTTIQDQNSVLAAKINYSAGNFTSGNYPVNFDASFSTGNITSYLWEFSGNPSVSSLTTAKPVVNYSAAGSYTAKLTVYDVNNNAASQTISFRIGDHKANLSTGKDSNGNLIAIDSEDDDWKGYDINGVKITPKVRHTYNGWSSADIGDGSTSQWITLNTSEGYSTYKSIAFTIPENATDAKLNLRSLSFTRNWTYLVKVNPDGSEDETEITKTQFLDDGAKGWLNSRSPKVDNYALPPGKYYIKVLVYSSNGLVRQSMDVNAVVICSAGLIYNHSEADETPTLGTNDSKTEKLKVYPIPTKGEINLAANDFISNVEVYDATGRIVQKQIYDAKSKNVKMTIHSTNGVYYLKIKTAKEVITQKIIKE